MRNGGAIYEALEKALRDMGILNLYACIGSPECDDEYLTANSADFHAHLGFVKVGEFHQCGYKFGRWYNMIWMEKVIGGHETKQSLIIPYPELKQGWQIPVYQDDLSMSYWYDAFFFFSRS